MFLWKSGGRLQLQFYEKWIYLKLFNYLFSQISPYSSVLTQNYAIMFSFTQMTKWYIKKNENFMTLFSHLINIIVFTVSWIGFIIYASHGLLMSSSPFLLCHFSTKKTTPSFYLKVWSKYLSWKWKFKQPQTRQHNTKIE